MGGIVHRILSFGQRTLRADIVRVFSFTVLSTVVKMFTGLISVKVVASMIGPSGVALVGQLNNFATIAMALASGGINNGITKYVAESKENEERVKDCLSTALRITSVCSLLVGAFLILFNSYLSKVILLSPDYNYVFVIFGFTILLYALNLMLISILNGFKEFKRYVRINIANSIIGLIFTLLFVSVLRLPGALISAVTYQSVMFFITLWMIRKLPWFTWNNFKQKISGALSKKYMHYTLMALTTAATVPVSQMLLRGYVISEISPIEAGWWEGMNRISHMYLLVITSSFSVYYLPRLSELKDSVEIKREMVKAYKVIIPMLLVAFTLVYLLRTVMIRILFTPEFLPMENLFFWQLAGDFFKICSWLLSFLMVAKSMTKAYVSTEVLFSLNFVILGFLFMRMNGVVGINQAYLVNYVAYLICMVVVFRKIIF